jgi:hypothetical protein
MASAPASTRQLFWIRKLSGIESGTVSTGESPEPSANGFNLLAPTGLTKREDAKRPRLRLVRD